MLRAPQHLALKAGLLSGLLGLGLTSGHADESRYTDISDNDCETIEVYEETGSTVQRCYGIDDWEVFISDDDGRMSIGFGAQGHYRTFAAFNSLGDVLEWRGNDGEPYATIVRYPLEAGDGTNRRASVLLVSRVSRNGFCPLALINASDNEQANGMARGAADMSRALFECPEFPLVLGKDKFRMAASFGGSAR